MQKTYKNIYLIVIIISISLLTVYLNIKNKDIQNSQTQTLNSSAQISKNQITLNDANKFYKIEITYPNDPLDKNQIIKRFFEMEFKNKQEDWKIGGEIYNKEQQAKNKNPNSRTLPYSYYVNFDRIESKKIGTVTYIFNAEIFTGTQNAINKITTFTFDKKDRINYNDKSNILGLYIGNVLNITDGNDIKISKMIMNRFLTEKDNNPLYKDLVEQGLMLDCIDKNNEIVKTNKKCIDNNGYMLFSFVNNLINYAITDTGITFIFEKYQIAAGVEGTPKVSLSWEELKPFLNTNFKF